ncbi:hypothetical protein KMZ27_21565 [Pseudomonas shirazica]|nr:hypothetical protein [Pseudomonas shirazica]
MTLITQESRCERYQRREREEKQKKSKSQSIRFALLLAFALDRVTVKDRGV